MILDKLVINGLFGHFNHSVKFKEGNVTIITAPNGYGKTVCLKIIDAIFKKKLTFLCELQFSEIMLYTSEGTISIKKNHEKKPNSINLSHSKVKKSYEYSSDYEFSKSSRLSPAIISNTLPFLDRIGPREWEDHFDGEILNYREIIQKYQDKLPHGLSIKEYPDWYQDFCSKLSTHFIQDQRLIQRQDYSSHRGSKSGFVDTIEKYADELSELIKRSGSSSSAISQQLDTTFPVRLLRRDIHFRSLSKDELKDNLQALQEKREKLSSFNLLMSEQHLPELDVFNDIKEEDTKVLTLYVTDTTTKLSAYDAIYNQIEIFSRILNNKRLSFKKVKIDSEKGFYFETEDGRPLKLTQLSAGEQHQVVLLFELAFKTKPNVLVLIDEPEISLHVAWQKEFLFDLQDLIKIQDMPVVIATHSPQIIGNNWDLTVDLEQEEIL